MESSVAPFRVKIDFILGTKKILNSFKLFIKTNEGKRMLNFVSAIASVKGLRYSEEDIKQKIFRIIKAARLEFEEDKDLLRELCYRSFWGPRIEEKEDAPEEAIYSYLDSVEGISLLTMVAGLYEQNKIPYSPEILLPWVAGIIKANYKAKVEETEFDQPKFWQKYLKLK